MGTRSEVCVDARGDVIWRWFSETRAAITSLMGEENQILAGRTVHVQLCRILGVHDLVDVAF